MRIAPFCQVCQYEKMVYDVAEMIPCGHIFHTKCINPWLAGDQENRRQCPICRSQVTGLKCCLKHREIACTRMSPLVIKRLGMDIIKEVDTDTLKTWQREVQMEGARLNDSASNLMKQIKDNADQHRTNNQLMGCLADEIKSRETSGQMELTEFIPTIPGAGLTPPPGNIHLLGRG